MLEKVCPNFSPVLCIYVICASAHPSICHIIINIHHPCIQTIYHRSSPGDWTDPLMSHTSGSVVGIRESALKTRCDGDLAWMHRSEPSDVCQRKTKKIRRHLNATLRFKAWMKGCFVSGGKWKGRSEVSGGQTFGLRRRGRGRGRRAGVSAGRGPVLLVPTAVLTFHILPLWVFNAALCRSPDAGCRACCSPFCRLSSVA